MSKIKNLSSRSLWIIAIIITLFSAYYQRVTGPTYDLRGSFIFDNQEIEYRLGRSHAGPTDHEVKIEITDNDITGILSYKRYKTDDPWTEIVLERDGDILSGFLPHQPPAGKLMYNLKLQKSASGITVPEDQPVVIRFRGDVPALIIIPHVFIMFLSMLISTRAGFEALLDRENIIKLAYWSAGTLFVGGMIFGPIMQEYAFGELWTGFPFGYDLTDNKTLIAMIGWIVTLIAIKRGKNPRLWVLGAAILQFIIYMIPHSVLGSELDYSEMPEVK
ncbi:MAG: hypothetical protein GY863_03250 [bacterium]|nr:hypothetical protein [bacterium]